MHSPPELPRPASLAAKLGDKTSVVREGDHMKSGSLRFQDSPLLPCLKADLGQDQRLQLEELDTEQKPWGSKDGFES